MAQVRKIYVEKVKNLGNYESARVGVEVELEEGDEPREVYQSLRVYVSELAELDETSIKIARQEAKIRSGN